MTFLCVLLILRLQKLLLLINLCKVNSFTQWLIRRLLHPVYVFVLDLTTSADVTLGLIWICHPTFWVAASHGLEVNKEKQTSNSSEFYQKYIGME